MNVTDLPPGTIDNTGSNYESFTITPGLRFVERDAGTLDGTSLRRTIRVLQQMHQGSNGTQRWEDVPLVRE